MGYFFTFLGGVFCGVLVAIVVIPLLFMAGVDSRR